MAPQFSSEASSQKREQAWTHEGKTKKERGEEEEEENRKRARILYPDQPLSRRGRKFCGRIQIQESFGVVCVRSSEEDPNRRREPLRINTGVASHVEPTSLVIEIYCTFCFATYGRINANQYTKWLSVRVENKHTVECKFEDPPVFESEEKASMKVRFSGLSLSSYFS